MIVTEFLFLCRKMILCLFSSIYEIYDEGNCELKQWEIIHKENDIKLAWEIEICTHYDFYFYINDIPMEYEISSTRYDVAKDVFIIHGYLTKKSFDKFCKIVEKIPKKVIELDIKLKLFDNN